MSDLEKENQIEEQLEAEAEAELEEEEEEKEEETPGQLLHTVLYDHKLTEERWTAMTERRKELYEEAAGELDITV